MDINKIIESAKKHFGNNAILFDDLDEFSEVKRWIPTGIPDVDLLLNTFGLPSSKIIECCGDPQSGKTSFSLHCLKSVQKIGGIGILISSERRDNKVYAKNIGIDTKKVIIHKTKTIEESFRYIKEEIEFLRNITDDIPILIIWDSLGGTPTKAELNADEDQNFMAVAAKVIKQNLRVVTQMIDDGKTTLLINNQTYSKIGQLFGKKKTSYGGDAVKFHSSIRLEVSKISTIKGKVNGKEEKIGQVSRFEVLKSDYSMPLRIVDVDLLFGYGYVPSKSSLVVAESEGILKKYGQGGYVITKIPNYKWKSQNEYFQLFMNDVKFRNLINLIVTKAVHKHIENLRGV